MSKKLIFAAVCFFAAAFAFVPTGFTIDKARAKRRAPLEITVAAWGPTQADVDAAKLRAERQATTSGELRGVKYRLLGFEYLSPEIANKSSLSPAPTRFRATFYDYTNDRTLIAESDFAGTEPVVTRWEKRDPGVSVEEIRAAYGLAEQDAGFSGLHARKRLELYEAMPPTSNLDGERLVNIGVRDLETGENQIVGVSFKNNKIVRYKGNAPPTAIATPESCGIANANQGSTGQGVAGQYQLTVSQSGNPLWEMLVVRPSASSGAPNELSGLEIRDVRYKSKSVLKRGHVPILNVKYVTSCGPFRDWQYAEGFFNAPSAGAVNPAPGIRVLAAGQVATTAIETRNDLGNFQGVAIYIVESATGSEVVMVTEMDAGWYRYIMEWRFGSDGTIRPRYGFGSVTDSCVCIERTHHVYWRFDFDVVSPNNKIYKVERGRKFLTLVNNETAMFRSNRMTRGLLIQNSAGDEAFQLWPGANDGTVTNAFGELTDTFGGGDFWLLRFKGTAATPDELNDPNTTRAANLAPWLTNESLVDQDIVVWYAAHQTRVDDRSIPNAVISLNDPIHIVGPSLRPVRW